MKCDPNLGKLVHQHLKEKGLETPFDFDSWNSCTEIKKLAIQGHFKKIMNVLGLDLSDDSLRDTPKRVAQMFIDEIFWGLDYSKFPKCTRIENKMYAKNNFLLERNINVKSCCEHHFVVIDGVAHVAYIPKDYVVGLSKLNRIVNFFSRRPQVQERLTEQIAETVSYITESPDVAVMIEGTHYCVRSRGIEDVGSDTVTIATRGVFADLDSRIRAEFFNSVVNRR